MNEDKNKPRKKQHSAPFTDEEHETLKEIQKKQTASLKFLQETVVPWIGVLCMLIGILIMAVLPAYYQWTHDELTRLHILKMFWKQMVGGAVLMIGGSVMMLKDAK